MAEELSKDDWEAAVAAKPKTKPGSHKATQRGYAAGNIIEADEPVPAGIAISDEWMAKVEGTTSAGERAAQETSQDIKGDPALTELSLEALQAMATERGVTSVKGLKPKDLIQAIQSTKDVRA